ncbi:MAG: D-glycerate dehydrogenase [Dehalococcoidia bacterium]
MRVFVTRELPGEGLQRLRARPDLDVEVWSVDGPPPHDELLARVRGVDGIICLITDRVDAQVLDAAGPQLKVVSQVAVGVDNIDVATCGARGIVVGHTPDVLTETTADLAFALLLASARRIVEAADYVRAGQWQTWSPTTLAGADAHGATLGIVGLGAIGQALARRAAGFQMQLLYWSRHEKPEIADTLGARYRPLPDLLAESDFVSIHAALSPETHHLIDADALARMPAHAVLINSARGPLVDEEALIAALRSGAIAGAALDVTEQEPIALDSPLLRMPNVIVLPHIGSASLATRTRMADLAVDNLLAGLRGAPLPHAIRS